MLDYDSLLELVKSRRSIRRFKPDPVPNEYIDKIIEVARWAHSGANSQPWQFVVVKKQELKDKIIGLVGEHLTHVDKMEVAREPEIRFISAPGGWVHAPVFIIVLGDPRTKEAYPLPTTLERGEQNFVSSLASAFLYMNLAVTTLGLGGQWVSATSSDYPQTLIKNLLGIPRQMHIYDMLALGYPDMQPKPRILRDKERLVHHDYYDKAKYPSDQQVKEFIASLLAAKRQK